MGYTPSFTPQYENGWEDLPSETSPITAEALNAYDDAIENIEEYLASDESQANLADAYDETATYEAGDYVIYGGDLYKCLEDIDEPEEWDSTKWESCLITDEMATSGGTNVIANPSGEATETLTKLQVDETIYGISGGGGNANIWTGTQAELEEVFDELEEGTQINITDDEQEVVEGGTIYSEEEQVIGLWIDNKPLYQRTFVNSFSDKAKASRSYIVVTEDMSSSDYNIIDVNGYVQFTSGNRFPISLYATDFIQGSTDQNSAYVSYIVNATGVTTLLRQNFIDGTASGEIVTTLKYTKASDAPLDAVVGKKTMYIASSDCYSTEEKEIGCAPNGKPLYQKTILHENPFTGSESLQTIAHGISNFDEAVSITGFIYDAHESSPSWMPLPRFYTSNAFGISHVTTSDIYIYIPSAFGTRLRNARITIQYTKTTDTAGSGSYTPASGKAVHYSTDEQVIGTWVDGSTLYRKSFTITQALTVSNSVWTDTGFTITNGRIAVRAFAVRNTDTGQTFPVIAYIENSSLKIEVCWSSQLAFPAGSIITLEYTKTTD